jgi:hypothetical protein
LPLDEAPMLRVVLSIAPRNRRHGGG